MGNEGSAPLSDLEIDLPVARGLIYEGVNSGGEGREVTYTRAPQPAPGQPQPNPTGTIQISDLSVAPDVTTQIKLRFRVDPNLEEDRALCLQATLRDITHDASVDPGDGRAMTALNCVEGTIVFGRVGGRVFEDLNRDGVYQEDNDISFKGMIISAWPISSPEGPPTATDSTGAEGNYELSNLRPGDYQVRLKSSQGVVYKTASVNIVALERLEFSLTIEPTGRVYESISGDLLDGAELFLYRDEDTDDGEMDHLKSLGHKMVREMSRELSSALALNIELTRGSEIRFTREDLSVNARVRVSQGAVSQGAVSQGAVSQGAVSQGAVSQGAQTAQLSFTLTPNPARRQRDPLKLSDWRLELAGSLNRAPDQTGRNTSRHDASQGLSQELLS